MDFDHDAAHRACVSRTFSPRTDALFGKAAARSQADAAHLTIPQMLNAGNDMQVNNTPTGPEHTEPMLETYLNRTAYSRLLE